MAILKEPSLDFAREHIEKFYDSDFFPKQFEFLAMWHFWPQVKAELMSKNIGKLTHIPPRRFAAPKPTGTYRVVHQLDPIDALVYTAIAVEIAPHVEAARQAEEKHIACAYRFKLKDGSLFSEGTGWTEFNSQTEALSKQFKFVLTTDITDFYNQIYLHRLNNSIEHASASLKGLAADLEKLVSTLNDKSSQGIPVGPAASIVFSEAVLMDVDEYIINAGFSHTRYVDDFRIFSNSQGDLKSLLENLTVYLYEQHRLTIATEKTKIYQSDEFVKEHLHNHYVEQKLEIYETLEVLNPYTDEYEEIEFPIEQGEKIEKILSALHHILSLDRLDLGLARSVIRAAKHAKIAEIAPDLLKSLEFFAPVINDVILYLQDVSDDAFLKANMKHFLAATKSDATANGLVRHWLEWYFAQHPSLLKEPFAHEFLFKTGKNIEFQAVAAAATKNIVWVKSQKANVQNLSGPARRALLNATRILTTDERTNWLKMVAANSNAFLDKLVADWVIATSD